MLNLLLKATPLKEDHWLLGSDLLQKEICEALIPYED